jgi:hypothetical protein
MIANLPIFVGLFASSALAIALIFLPALTELKRPRDAGPRLITDGFTQKMLSDLKTQIINLEDNWKTDNQLTVRIFSVLDFIPNLEA